MCKLGSGEMILKGRKRLGWTQRKLAKAVVDATPSYICKLERGENPPSDELCVKIAKVLGLDEKKLRLAALAEREPADLIALLTDDQTEPESTLTQEEQQVLSLFSRLDSNWRKVMINLLTLTAQLQNS